MEALVKTVKLFGAFWLLVSAWLFANVPQSAYVGLIQRFEGMQHFSHQAQLAADTLSVLQGRSHSAVVKSESPPRKSPRPSPAGALGESLFKKLEFALSVYDGVRAPIEVNVHFLVFQVNPPPVFFGDVPHPPPRNGVIG